MGLEAAREQRETKTEGISGWREEFSGAVAAPTRSKFDRDLQGHRRREPGSLLQEPPHSLRHLLRRIV